jgi:hypothetical protein
LRPIQANSSQDLISKITREKKGWRWGSSGREPVLKHEALTSTPSLTKKERVKELSDCLKVGGKGSKVTFR